MMSVKEIKKLKLGTQKLKASALSRGDDLSYRLHCKVEKVLNQILGEEVDARYKKNEQ